MILNLLLNSKTTIKILIMGQIQTVTKLKKIGLVQKLFIAEGYYYQNFGISHCTLLKINTLSLFRLFRSIFMFQ